jgi:hypothetical protein
MRKIFPVGACVLATAVAALATAPAVRATPANYVFSGASVLLNFVTAEQVTGSFTFDPITGIESAASITLTGAAPYADTYSFPLPPEKPALADIVGFGTLGGALFISFVHPLTSDPLTFNFIGVLPDGSVSEGVDLEPAGNADPTDPVAVPEPGSLAVFGMALGFLALGPWALRRARREDAG